MNKVLLSFIFISLGSCAFLHKHEPSIVDLNTNPGIYDGQRIAVRGFLLGGPEPIAIVTKLGVEKYYEKLALNCLSIVNFDGLNGQLGTKLDKKYVEVTGVFRRDSHGISVTSCGLTGIDIEGDPKKTYVCLTDVKLIKAIRGVVNKMGAVCQIVARLQSVSGYAGSA